MLVLSAAVLVIGFFKDSMTNTMTITSTNLDSCPCRKTLGTGPQGLLQPGVCQDFQVQRIDPAVGVEIAGSRLAQVGISIFAPDGLYDRARGAGNSGPGLGAFNVALIGGDITLRASAAISQASGTSTAVDNLGWVKGFSAHLDVTQTRNGATAKLDVYLQTQLASGDWQDIAHFTQVGVSVTAEIVDWGPGDGNISGIGAEGSAMTFDRFFAEQDAALGAATIRVMNLGDSMRVKWVYTAGDSSADDYTFALVMTPHS